MSKITRLAAVLVPVALLTACSDEQTPAPVPSVQVNPIPGLPDDFIKGADVSMLAQIEASGGQFYDDSGVEKDCLEILKEHGINWVRLRLWNNPVLTAQITTKDGPMGPDVAAAGINDAARDTELAKRAKALGMKVLLDFHYSDWWADPGQQIIPVAWTGLTNVEMGDALYDFTYQVLSSMKAEGATPDMVQIGNEVQNGMLWDLPKGVGRSVGLIDWENPDPDQYDAFAALLTKGSQAVRAVDPSIQIVIQLADGGSNDIYRAVFSELIARDVDFDIIGLSYYPEYTSHGPLSALEFNMNDISRYFNKPVIVAETAYAFTLENADSEGNIFGPAQETTGGYLATVLGQATLVRNVMEAVSNVPDGKGLGVFYWEPDWIAVEGAGWKTGSGNAWDNQAMFDSTGKALASLDVFWAVSADLPFVEPMVVSVVEQSIAAPVSDEAPILPSTARVLYSDDSVRELYVVWDEVAVSEWGYQHTFDISGKVAGVSISAVLHADVRPNLLQDPGFESATLDSWVLTHVPDDADLASHLFVKDNSGNAHSGTHAFDYWYGSSFNFTIAQTVNGLVSGTPYSFSVWAMGKAGSTLEAFADCGGDVETTTITGTGWQIWTQYTISGLDGSSGSCTVGVRTPAGGAAAEDWGDLDDFMFTY